MIVFNTTYSIHNSVFDSCVKFLKNTIIPSMIEDGFASPLLMQIQQEVEPDYTNVALQLFSPSDEHLNQWLVSSKQDCDADIYKLFGERVLSFFTIMQPL